MMKPKRYGKVRRRAGRFQGLLKVGTGLTLAVTLAMLSGCPVPPPVCTTDEDCADTPDTPLCLVDPDNSRNNDCVQCLTDADCPQGVCAQGQGYICLECIADTDCDDGDLCTTDVCDAATCTFTPVGCPDGQVCDPATGSCIDIECEDDADCAGTFCDPEVCENFFCVAGADPCPGQICIEAAQDCVDCLADADCPDDGQYCNGTEFCNVETNTCESTGNPCAEGETCNEDTDTCEIEGCVEDADCDDGDLCTEDICLDDGTCDNPPVSCPQGQSCNPANGECEGIVCTSNEDCDDGASCTQDVCLVSTGECIYNASDAACDDGLYCTGDGGTCEPNDPDVADDGTGCVRPGNPCSGDTPICNESADSCEGCDADTDCDDGVDCTDDTCQEDGACTNGPNNAFCDDGLYCTGVETCDLADGCVSSGTPCENPTPVCDEDANSCKGCQYPEDCDDDVPCTDDACNGVTGDCFNTPNDTNCPDPLWCDGVDVCDPTNDDADGNGCVGPGNPCSGTTPICVEGDPGSCRECDGNPECDDDIACTVDQCNIPMSGMCDNAPDDALCPGPGDPGSAVICDPDLGCVECLFDGDCSDGLYCTGVETCDALGNCQPGTPVDCDDGVDCTDDSCNEGTDSCDNVPNDALCLDPGAPYCDPVLGCVECINNADCSDGLYCTGVETCDALGNCQPGTPVNCDDGVDCTDDSCNEGTDSCDNVPNDANCPGIFDPPWAVFCHATLGCVECLDNADCDDGLFCNGFETCVGGACQPGAYPCGNLICEEPNVCRGCVDNAECVAAGQGWTTCDLIFGFCS